MAVSRYLDTGTPPRKWGAPRKQPWVRNPAWLALPSVSETDQKFVGLHAVYEHGSNFVALSAQGNYTVNWGDGTGNQNFNGGAAAQTNLAWANAPATSDVGIADAVTCTFQGSADTVTVNGHDFKDGERVAFASITTTTGITAYTTYFVRDATTNTFKVASSIGGTAIDLVNDGVGTVYRPKYRQVIVTVTPNGGNLTQLNLHFKHNQSGLQVYSSGFLDIAIAGEYLTDLRIGVQTPGSVTQTIRFADLEQVNIVRSDLRQLSHLFYNCYSLQNIVRLETSTAPAVSGSVTFQDAADTVTWNSHGFRDGDSVIFTSITTTTGINTYTTYFVRDVTADTFKVASSYGGTAINLVNNGSGTALRGTAFVNVFYNCYSLANIPLFDTAAGIIFSGMFYNCSSLNSIPLLNTEAATNFSSMFYGCGSLSSIPMLNTASGVNFSAMFQACSSLTSVPAINTASATNVSNMFLYCYSLQSARLNGTPISISCANCKLSGEALNEIYRGLKSEVTSQTITVTNNWGTASDDPSIATAKGWTVVGS